MRDATAGDAALVVAALAGDGRAFAALFDGWFDRCFDVAVRIVRNRDIAAEVVQEVFLAAWRDLGTLRDHAAFGGWVLRASRNRALNRLEKERRTVALGDEATTAAVDAEAAAPDAAVDALTGIGADLVWAASAALGERDSSILDLHLRHGLAAPALAEELGVTANNAHQLLFRLRARLGDAIRSFVLWHGGRPSCPELQDVLHRAGLAIFGPEAARLAQRHAASCERSGDRQRTALAPEAPTRPPPPRWPPPWRPPPSGPPPRSPRRRRRRPPRSPRGRL
ncbi:MAG: sigma-70 family RNA polymerase sigma factor [Acidimicrobiales bacterium]